jgi:7,8-dihydropterin-6-yl-methyl-4-(beta-D-ribofuranosyl)aminobenzene 5'-phosphate synthase
LEINKNARLYIKKEAFHYKIHGDRRFIGTPFKPVLLDNRTEYVSQITQIDEGIYIMPDVPLKNKLDTHFKNLNINDHGRLINDEFNDELFLAVVNNNELSVISSCSHRGITNILEAATSIFKLPVNMILGGFHLKDAKPGQLDTIVEYIRSLNPKSIGVCHCTGVEKYAQLLQIFRTKVFYNSTGNSIEI